ncbi:unnamed protein product [Phyllotreta striolata]|uniref:Uncharacterized protein n=1 Tax=Phyllotreta striolata TaxID=444603 RepID=A0A9N9TJP0_PHYSR|nr:unnamed protein product [Phyllotreta striolata]
MFSCPCLNILIETASSSSEFPRATPDLLNLSETERKDVFFRQDLLQISKLKNIVKTQPNLVHTRHTGNWMVHCCINCIKEIYALHKEKGASCVVVSTKLLDAKSIERIRAESIQLSKIFNIIVNPCDIREDTTLLKLYKKYDAEAIVKNIRETVSEFMRKEMLAVEDRIKKYTEEQFESMNSLRDTAYEEHDHLVTLVQSLSNETQLKSTKNPMSSEGSQQDTSQCSEFMDSGLLLAAGHPKQTKRSPKRQRSTPVGHSSSFDAEGLFDFEGSDGVTSHSESDVGESDKDDKDDRIHASRPRSQKMSVAKSLPMNIPTFLSRNRNTSSEDLDDITQSENLDIAASIKALAKSVHGDAVFGELPPPRFSTQL